MCSTNSEGSRSHRFKAGESLSTLALHTLLRARALRALTAVEPTQLTECCKPSSRQPESESWAPADSPCPDAAPTGRGRVRCALTDSLFLLSGGQCWELPFCTYVRWVFSFLASWRCKSLMFSQALVSNCWQNSIRPWEQIWGLHRTPGKMNSVTKGQPIFWLLASLTLK